MDWLQFISSLIESLAWPSTIVVLVLLLRTPVTQLLQTLTKLKYKDLELDFGSELRAIKNDAKSIVVEPNARQALPELGEDKKFHLAEAKRLAPDFPEPAIAVGWRAVEDSLFDAVDRLQLASEKRANFPPSQNIEMLRSAGYLDAETVDVLRRMRNLRNIAVYGGKG